MCRVSHIVAMSSSHMALMCRACSTEFLNIPSHRLMLGSSVLLAPPRQALDARRQNRDLSGRESVSKTSPEQEAGPKGTTEASHAHGHTPTDLDAQGFGKAPVVRDRDFVESPKKNKSGASERAARQQKPVVDSDVIIQV